jgi:hypothetical protein
MAQGITINGLPLAIRNEGFPVDIYYEDCVIGGPGAFALPVLDAKLFELSIQRKLFLEIAGLPPRLLSASQTSRPVPRIDCETDVAATR